MPAPASAQRPSDSSRQPSRRALKAARFARRVLAFSLLIIVVAVGALVWQTRGRAYYARWQRQKQLGAAELAFRANDFTNAARLAREVGAVETANVRAVEIAAGSLDQLGSPDALRWLRRLAELKRNDEAALQAWAYAAFRQDDLRSAYQALRLFPRGSDSAAFHDIAGRVALSRNDQVQARQHFARALALAPDSPEIQIRFAEVHVDSTEAAEHERSVRLLEQLSTNGVHSAAALGALTREALQRGDAVRAERFSAQLLARPNLTFADRLVHLSTLRAGRSPEYPAEMARLQAEAAGDPAQLPRWLNWKVAQNETAEALGWFATLPAETQNFAPVMAAAAELYVKLEDWKGLREWVFNANWGALECRRLAYQALANGRLSAGGLTTVAAPWQAALKAAKAQPEHLHWMAAQAEAWELWQPAETTLWLMVQKEIDADGSLERLASLYRRLNQANNLLKVAKRQLELHPRDPSFEADALYYGALLRVEPLQLKTLAERVRPRIQESPEYATALAMYLARAGASEEGRAILDGFRADQFTPARKALHILLLAQVSDRANARRELEQATRHGMLPEEAAMLDEAQALARAESRAQ